MQMILIRMAIRVSAVMVIVLAALGFASDLGGERSVAAEVDIDFEAPFTPHPRGECSDSFRTPPSSDFVADLFESYGNG